MPRQQLVFITLHDLLEHRKVEAPSCHSSKGDDLPGLRAQLVRPLLHGILHAAWNRHVFAPLIWMQLALPDPVIKPQTSTSDQEAKDFLNQARVPLRPRPDTSNHSPPHS